MENAKKNGLDIVVRSVKYRIDSLVEEADKYTRSMNEDYEYFFQWYAEEMYKVQRKLACYRALNKVLGSSTDEEIKTYIKNMISSFADRLLTGSLRRSSTNYAANLAHTLELEADQELREKFIMLLNIMEQGDRIEG